MKIKLLIVSFLALFGNLFLFLCVMLPGMLNQGYFAGDLNRYGEMLFEFIMVSITLLASGSFLIYAIVGVFRHAT